MKVLIALVALVLLTGCNAAAVSPTSPTIVTPPPDVPPPVVPPPPTPVTLTIDLGREELYTGEGLTLYANLMSGQVLTPATYAWVFGDGATETTTTGAADHVYTRRGAYTASVTLRDRDGRTADASRVVTITNRPTPPQPPPPPAAPPAFTATLTCTDKPAGSPSPCNLTVTYHNATVPSQHVTHVDWDWGDGIADSTTEPSHAHVYQYAGTYTIFATVTANTKDGLKTITKSVTIEVL